MNKAFLEFNLHFIGLTQVLLALSHLTFKKRFNWEREISQLSLLNRQIFYVHTFFVAFTVFGMGLLGIFVAEQLLIASPLAAFVSGGLLVFWLVRTYCQFFYYDKRLWVNQPFRTRIHLLFSISWIWYCAVYGDIFCHQLLCLLRL